MEKIIAKQIKSHVNGSGLDNGFQSAYKSFPSTETALLSVQNDILNSIGQGKVTDLTLLDLSAAFDTILSFWIDSGTGLVLRGLP